MNLLPMIKMENQCLDEARRLCALNPMPIEVKNPFLVF